MQGNRFKIPVIVIATMIVAVAGCMQRQAGIRGVTPQQKKIPANRAFYEDDRVAVYGEGGKTSVLNKETGQEIKVGPSKAVEIIRDKTAQVPPLVGVPVREGIKLVNNDEIDIIETKPNFRHLYAFPNPRTKGDKIIIDKSTNTLYLYSNGELYKAYPVATGKEPGYTPEGSFKIINKTLDKGNGDELKDQLGVCWMGLSVPCEKDNRADSDGRAPEGHKYGIHGTDKPDSIGSHASGGCIRMTNEQAVELYDLVDVGMPVEIK